MKNKLGHSLRKKKTLKTFTENKFTVHIGIDEIEVHESMVFQHFWQFQQKRDRDKRLIRRNAKSKNTFLRKIMAVFIEKFK
jgi:hypothetical protein